MQTPGAARSIVGPKLVKYADVSSLSERHVLAPAPPALPSKSASAETMNGSGQPCLSWPSLPADIANATPSSIIAQAAWWSAPEDAEHG